MKIFLYTVSDFTQNALDCVDLLNNSLQINNDIKLNIIANTDPPANCPYNVYVDKTYRDIYPGFLKYSDEIPSDYDHYVYFDSDILCFENIENILSPSGEISVVQELLSTDPNNNKFFNYFKKSFNKDEYAINAGTFALSDRNLLRKIKNLCDNNISPNNLENGQMEQSAYNAVCYESGLRFNNIVDKVKLFAGPYTIPQQETIFHFCNFEGTMVNKFHKMSFFYDKNKSRYT